MAKKGKTKYVLLGLIADGPKTGYEIKQTIERSIGYFWQESYGQIYPVLHFLLKENYITSKSISQKGKPDKIIYSITKSGIRHLEEWLTSSVDIAPHRNELLLRVFFGRISRIPHNISMLENHIEMCTKLYKTFVDLKKIIKENCVIDSGPIENSTYSMLTLEYGIMSFHMEIEWAKKSIKQLKILNKNIQEKEKSI